MHSQQHSRLTETLPRAVPNGRPCSRHLPQLAVVEAGALGPTTSHHATKAPLDMHNGVTRKALNQYVEHASHDAPAHAAVAKITTCLGPGSGVGRARYGDWRLRLPAASLLPRLLTAPDAGSIKSVSPVSQAHQTCAG